MALKDYFPDMREGAFPLADQDWISVEVGEQYLHFPKSSLSEREQLLLGLGRQRKEPSKDQRSPWYHYLILGQGEQPKEFQGCQFIYINHQCPLAGDLIELLKGIIEGVEAVLPISQTRTAFLVCHHSRSDLFQLLADLLPTIESDFGLALTIFIGNGWYQVSGNALRDYFKEENAVFTAYLAEHSASRLQTFSEVMLWSLLANSGLPALSKHFSQLLLANKEVMDLVLAMWQEHGNLVQTAQRLYIHRNSLQYKLDKFAQQSGLHLKQLDDLAFAYLFILKH
ncbi:helix-turn-helix domain-containing protein [Streptococcus equi subsp. zooepidemicus]|uniref:helix-turn-helix domain-containing protein n=1 Tax=Streptococcus equi TaxID=1336 RepID=UPI00294AD110|nr:helix-turn-helix domain-containing protein [Streptococcus equi]WOK57067.1 helix-turn-helix domain-containing protein [Streptococcus equi subsp. zooepidemicus]